MSDDTQARLEVQSQPPATLPLDSILPDPNQPRRLLPADLMEAVITKRSTPVAALQTWLRRAERAQTETTAPALQHNVRELKRLADSIEQHGLISPISVRQPGPEESLPAGAAYLIITGERRYWAHVYLLSEGKQIHEGETISEPSQIKATIAPAGITIRAHQLIENLLREDINAIERARGMWILRYELSGVNYSSPDEADFEGVNYSSPFTTDLTGVNYSSPQLVAWSQVEQALGISKRYRIFVTSVLKLSPEARELVEAHNLAEMTIRPIVQKLKEKPELQLKALNQLIAWQAENEAEGGPGRAIVASVRELVDKLLAAEAGESAAAKITRSVSSAPVVRFHSKVRQTLDFLGRLKPNDREGLTEALGRDEFAEVMIDLRILRQQIDTILDSVTTSQPPDHDRSPSKDYSRRA
jgi:hypothetical protein